MTRDRRTDRAILQGFLAGLIFLLFAKVGGALKEMQIAHSYGTSDAVNAYALGFSVANSAITLGTMCANMVLVPQFVASFQSASNNAIDSRALLFRTVLLSLPIALLVFSCLTFGAGALFSITPAVKTALEVQAAGLALMIPPGLCAAILAARLMAKRRQISALMEVVPAAIICAGILVLGHTLSAGPLLAWSTGIGMICYALVLYWADSSVLDPSEKTLSRPDNALSKGILIILIAQVIFLLGGVLLDQFAAASLKADDNAVIAYANRLLMLLTGLGATAIGRAVLPIMSEASLKQTDELEHIARSWSLRLFAGGVVCIALGNIFGGSLVQIIFQHGKFTEYDAKAVTDVFRAGLWQLPFYFSSLILAQKAVARRRYALLLAANLGGVATKLVLVFLFLQSNGIVVLMYGTAAMYAVSLGIFTLMGNRGARSR